MKTEDMVITLKGEEISNLTDFYDVLAKRLAFPSHFGRNLDALWDFLSTDQEKPLTIRWINSEESQFSLGDQFDKLIELFDQLSEERKDFHYILE